MAFVSGSTLLSVDRLTLNNQTHLQAEIESPRSSRPSSRDFAKEPDIRAVIDRYSSRERRLSGSSDESDDGLQYPNILDDLPKASDSDAEGDKELYRHLNLMVSSSSDDEDDDMNDYMDNPAPAVGRARMMRSTCSPIQFCHWQLVV